MPGQYTPPLSRKTVKPSRAAAGRGSWNRRGPRLAGRDASGTEPAPVCADTETHPHPSAAAPDGPAAAFSGPARTLVPMPLSALPGPFRSERMETKE